MSHACTVLVDFHIPGRGGVKKQSLRCDDERFELKWLACRLFGKPFTPCVLPRYSLQNVDALAHRGWAMCAPYNLSRYRVASDEFS